MLITQQPQPTNFGCTTFPRSDKILPPTHTICMVKTVFPISL